MCKSAKTQAGVGRHNLASKVGAALTLDGVMGQSGLCVFDSVWRTVLGR